MLLDVQDLRVTGYLVWRTALGAGGLPEGKRAQLTLNPVSTPAFHDATAQASASYRYEVSAVDAKGNVSPAAKADVQALLP